MRYVKTLITMNEKMEISINGYNPRLITSDFGMLFSYESLEPSQRNRRINHPETELQYGDYLRGYVSKIYGRFLYSHGLGTMGNAYIIFAVGETVDEIPTIPSERIYQVGTFHTLLYNAGNPTNVFDFDFTSDRLEISVVKNTITTAVGSYQYILHVLNYENSVKQWEIRIPFSPDGDTVYARNIKCRYLEIGIAPTLNITGGNMLLNVTSFV